MARIDDGLLRAIAKGLGNHPKLLDLGIALKLKLPIIRAHLATNKNDADASALGTTFLLTEWRDGVAERDQRNTLRMALLSEEVKLVGIAEKFLPQDGETQCPPANNESAPANRGSTSENRANLRSGNTVTEGQLLKLARIFPEKNYMRVCNELGTNINEANNILSKHLKDHEKALREVLVMWRDRTSGYRAELDHVLREVDESRLVTEF